MLRRTAALARRQRVTRNMRACRCRRAGLFMAKFPADRVATEEALIAEGLLLESDRDNTAKVAAAMTKVWATWLSATKMRF